MMFLTVPCVMKSPWRVSAIQSIWVRRTVRMTELFLAILTMPSGSGSWNEP